MPYVLALVALILHDFMKSPVFYIVLDNKGGVGKSLMAQIIATLLRHDGKYIVKMVDTDYSNSTTRQIDQEARMINLRELVSKGIVVNLLKDLGDKVFNHIVMDVGAREEHDVIKLLPMINERMRAIGGQVVVGRPITLGSHNQRNAIDFLKVANELSIPVVFIRNHGGGRHEEYYERWLSSKAREGAIAGGVVETVLEDGHVLYADEAIGYGLSLAECALRDFSKLEDNLSNAKDEEEAESLKQDLEDAQAFFDLDVAAFLAEWLRDSIRDFGAATAEAIANRAPLDAVPPEDGNAVKPTAKSKPRKG